MPEEFTIMYEDLNENVQKELLEFYGIASPAEMNWDIVPLCILEKSEEES